MNEIIENLVTQLQLILWTETYDIINLSMNESEKTKMYEVWTLEDDRALSFDEIEQIIEDRNDEVEDYWTCVETFQSEEDAYNFIETLDESKFPLIHDGKDFYL